MLGLLVGCIALGMRGLTTVGLKVNVFECGRCVTVKGKSKVHPCTDTETLYRPYGHKGSRGIALLFHDQRH